jgi:4-hydroxybenzoate polyprenyltransferase
MATLLVMRAAPHGIGPILVAPTMLAGQLSIGWSNDAADASRDAAAGREDKPIAAGRIGTRTVWAVAIAAAVAALAMAVVISPVTGALTAVIVGAGWAYNLGLKSTLASGLMYIAGFGPIPAFAASTLPGHPAPQWWLTAAAAILGLGAHFANVLPDLTGDKTTGVKGLPQQVAAHWGPRAAKGSALTLLLAASVLLLAAGRLRTWLAVAGLGAALLLVAVGARGGGRLPFLASIGIAAIDVVLFAVGGAALT